MTRNKTSEISPRSRAVRQTAALFASALMITGLAAGAAFSVESAGQETETAAKTCSEAGRWLDPATGKLLEPDAVVSEAAKGGIVLLGESHAVKENHLWQTHMLAGLHALNPDLVIGFEAFPRRAQPVLDDWSAGRLSDKEFLEKTRWNEVWRHNSALYMPLFDFARQNRLQMTALNVDRSLVSKVGKDGWAAIEEEGREGVGDPAPASADYRASLQEVFDQHSGSKEGAEAKAGEGEDKPSRETRLDRFVEAQLTWDRAMAEALATASRENPEAVVVGILGRGHVEYGHGVPHQLADLGVDRVTSLLPVTTGEDCEALTASIADAVFLVDDRSVALPAADKPRLGVYIEPAEGGGVLLLEIVDGSVAEATELSAGDILLTAAGTQLTGPRDLVEIVTRQAPGTWLPLEVQRDGKTLDLVAKFPTKEDAVQ